MAGSGGYAISITATDGATKTIDSLNKRLAALSAPAERFNKSLAKFGEASGVARATEGIRDLGRGAADAFRALDRMASPLAAMTGAASIAGVIELTRRWAQFGTQLGQISYRVGTPVESLSTLRGAMRLAGGDAAAADQGLRGLQDTLSSAAFGRNSGAVQMFNSLGVAFKDANGNARRANDVLGEVADKIQGLSPETQARVLNELGIGEGMLPLLKNGSKGLEEFRKQAERTGATMTKSMVDNATKMNNSWQELGQAIEGVGHRVVDSWSGTVTKVLDSSSKWIEHNKELTDSLAQIGGGIIALSALKPAAWVARYLGLGVVPEAAALASPMLLSGSTPGDNPMRWQYPDWDKMSDEQRDMLRQKYNAQPGIIGGWWKNNMPGWLGGRTSFGGAARGGAPPTAGTPAAGVAQRAHDFWRSKGYTEPQVAGILAGGPGAESGFDPTKIGDHGTSYGLYQHHADRWAAMQRRYGTQFPTEQQQNDYAAWELSPEGPEHAAGDAVRRSTTAEQSAMAFTGGFERPADPGEPMRRGRQAGRYVGLYDAGTQAGTGGAPGAPGASGHVQVDVHLKNAPPGTTTKVTTSGPVTAPPPRVETSLPGVH